MLLYFLNCRDLIFQLSASDCGTRTSLIKTYDKISILCRIKFCSIVPNQLIESNNFQLLSAYFDMARQNVPPST
jgi:hypothetical protein